MDIRFTREVTRNSKIEWTTHTSNLWWRCAKVSLACKHYYAEAWAKRVGQEIWEIGAGCRFFGDPHRRAPVRWNSEAARAGGRDRMFYAPIADIFEDRRDLDEARAGPWTLIDTTPHLDWLLLTKWPASVAALRPGERPGLATSGSVP